jgi:hypothetical protein
MLTLPGTVTEKRSRKGKVAASNDWPSLSMVLLVARSVKRRRKGVRSNEGAIESGSQ